MNKLMSIVDIMQSGGICIPKIQREYAQGRLDEKSTEVRNNFVANLMDCVFCGRTLSLDFVYGIGHGKSLMPLDGQQRLTTLFLLAWFCGLDMKEWFFDYESRRVAQYFMKGLREHPYTYQPAVIPTDFICNSLWYSNAWEDDPTVAGMLTMLDTMHKWMLKHKKAKADIVAENLSQITFWVKDLLQDKEDQAAASSRENVFSRIYLKMNARGLPLTDWENLKAILDKKGPEGWKKTIDNEWQEKLWEKADGDLGTRIRKVNVAMEKIVRLGLVHCEQDYNLSLADLDDWLKTNNAQELYAICTKYFSHVCAESFGWCWTSTRCHNLLWQATEFDQSFEKWLFYNREPSSSDKLRFAFISHSFTSLFESAFDKKENWRQRRILLNLLDNTEIRNEKYKELLQDGLAFLNKGKELGKLAFNPNQREDELCKLLLPSEDIVNLECDLLVYGGSLSFLRDGDNRTTLETFQTRLTFMHDRIKKDWREFFCAILQNLEYKGALRVPERIRIPQNFESVWAEELLANNYTYIIKSLSLIYKNDLVFDYACAPAWLKHFYDVLPQAIADGLNYLADKRGWNYCITARNISDKCIRLAWNDTERQNLTLLGKEFVCFDDHEKRYHRAETNNEIFYRIDQYDSTWWLKDEPNKYVQNGKDENGNVIYIPLE